MSSGATGEKQQGGEMPKDRAEVQDQYKIGGGSLNEYEYEQSKGEYEEQTHQVPDEAPVEGLRGAAEPGLPENGAKGASKKGAAKGGVKGAAKKSSKKSAAKKGSAGKGGVKGAAKKGAAKKS